MSENTSYLNRKTLEKAKKLFEKSKRSMLIPVGVKIGKMLSDHAYNNMEYVGNVTGNLVGSIGYGVYYNRNIITAQCPYADQIDETTLKEGESRMVGEDDKGNPIYYVAETGDSKYKGSNETLRFLRSYRPETKSLAIVIVVGVRYAEYRQSEKGLNTLMDTLSFARASGEKLITGKLDMANAIELPFEMPSDIDVPF